MQAILRQNNGNIDHTPGSNVAAGDVVVLGSFIAIALRDIAASTLGAVAVDGVFRGAKVAGAIAIGDPLYWDADGDPVGGTAGTGGLTVNGSLGNFAGYAIAAALDAGTTVDFVLASYSSPASFTSMPSATVAATGSAQGDAAAIQTGFTLVTAADATKGAKLPAAAAGKICVVKNSDAANAILKLYPATGDAINALAANAALSMAAKTSALLVAYDATTWYTTPLLPS